jgi:iron(III) transport system substrate-binding protein
LLFLFFVWLVPVISWAQSSKPTTLAELALHNGPDREQILLAGAKKEGKLVWYTALAGGSCKELARAFETKYGVQVEAYRGTSSDLIAKVLAETRAKIFAGRWRKFAAIAKKACRSTSSNVRAIAGRNC